MQNERIKELTEKFLGGVSEIVEKEVQNELKRRLGLALSSGVGNNRTTTKAVGPRRKIKMGCRQPGCRQRSKGPRFHFMCAAHLPNTAKEKHQAAAV